MSSIVALFAPLAGCAPGLGVGGADPGFGFTPRVAEGVDLARYAGRWYEISSIPSIASSFGLCRNTTAEYTPLDDGRVGIRNRCNFATFDGPVFGIEGFARAVDATNARLAVQLGGAAFEAPYAILLLDPDYQWAVVGSGDDSLFVLSRTPTLDPDLYETILGQLDQFGYARDRLLLTPQQ